MRRDASRTNDGSIALACTRCHLRAPSKVRIWPRASARETSSGRGLAFMYASLSEEEEEEAPKGLAEGATATAPLPSACVGGEAVSLSESPSGDALKERERERERAKTTFEGVDSCLPVAGAGVARVVPAHHVRGRLRPNARRCAFPSLLSSNSKVVWSFQSPIWTIERLHKRVALGALSPYHSPRKKVSTSLLNQRDFSIAAGRRFDLHAGVGAEPDHAPRVHAQRAS